MKDLSFEWEKKHLNISFLSQQGLVSSVMGKFKNYMMKY